MRTPSLPAGTGVEKVSTRHAKVRAPRRLMAVGLEGKLRVEHGEQNRGRVFRVDADILALEAGGLQLPPEFAHPPRGRAVFGQFGQ